MVTNLLSSDFNFIAKTNLSVNWEGVPAFTPTSTSDDTLKFICEYGGPERSIFEFGTWIGRSALGFSKNYKNVTTIDYTEGSDLYYAYQHNGTTCRPGELILETNNVEFINENSLDYDFRKYEDTFDVVFVDGNHSQYGCTLDIDNAMKISKINNSLIFIHDYGNPGMGVRAAVDNYKHDHKYYLTDIDLVVFINTTNDY